MYREGHPLPETLIFFFFHALRIINITSFSFGFFYLVVTQKSYFNDINIIIN